MSIVRTPYCCGGLARIDGRRLTVLWALDQAAAGLDGTPMTAAEIAEAWADGLTEAEVQEALDWAAAHPDEVEADRLTCEAEDRLLARTPGVLRLPGGSLYVPPGVALPEREPQ